MIKYLRNMKLRNKIMLSYFILILLPLGFFSKLTHQEVSKILENRIIYSANQSFNQATEYVSYKIDKIIKVSDNIAVNSYVKDILERDAKKTTSEKLHQDLNDLRSIISSFEDDKDIKNICIYVNDELLHSDEDDEIASISNAAKQRWYSQLPGSGSRVFMVPPSFYKPIDNDEQIILSVARRITRSTNYIDITGYLRIDFLERSIRDILYNANSVDGSLTYVRNRDDRIVSTTDNELLQKYRLSLANVNSLQNTDNWVILNLNQEDCYVRAKLIDDTDWTIITIIPMNDIFREVNKLGQLMLIFLIIIIPIAIALSYLIAYQITIRLSKLSDKMKLVTENVFNTFNEQSDYNDEIGELASSYNYMVERISTLAEEQYKLGVSIKSTELELLQAQINPHFLYNTLDMINWMSYDNRGNEIRKITKALSNFYKISLSKGANMITLRDELRHVSLYMEIQNYRSQNSIIFNIECEENLKSYLIPKITLQPIVENAVLHGILCKESKTGSIHIICKDNIDNIIITVEDDGIGMSDELIKNLHKEEGKKGFGLFNIHTRLMLTYSQQSGLEIESKVGCGTKVIVTIPKMK